LAIIASHVLGKSLATKASGRVDGFIFEMPTAGGHNAPPRGGIKLNERGEPIYGPKDEVNFAEMRNLGLPFWMAGSYGNPDGLKRAISEGAAGVQVGTAFAFSHDSGLEESLRIRATNEILATEKPSDLIFTDPVASPTGFPFKVLQMEQTIASQDFYEARPRKCDLGYLREGARLESGKVVFRCSAEPVDVYLAKGGTREETIGKKCLCNALMATTGLPQHQESGYTEQPLITSGDNLEVVAHLVHEVQRQRTLGQPHLVTPTAPSYGAADVIRYLRDGLKQTVRVERPEPSPFA
jgi:NAD(P)H-dependent flavin oxidoreductase YrpB (nitropropane dioxygenase family)